MGGIRPYVLDKWLDSYFLNKVLAISWLKTVALDVPGNIFPTLGSEDLEVEGTDLLSCEWTLNLWFIYLHVSPKVSGT